MKRIKEIFKPIIVFTLIFLICLYFSKKYSDIKPINKFVDTIFLDTVIYKELDSKIETIKITINNIENEKDSNIKEVINLNDSLQLELFYKLVSE